MQIFDRDAKYNFCKIKNTDNIIGILLDRNISMLSTIYSCWKNKITYVPIDPHWPIGRIEYIVKENKLETIITTKEYQHLVSVSNKLIMDKNDVVEFSKSFPENEISYVIYTSGSTGEPKGVEILRDSLLNFIDGITEIIDFSLLKTIACLSSATFDIFFVESILALEKGLTIVLANYKEQHNPILMSKLLKQNSVEIIQITPSMMQMLLNYDKDLLCLKKVKVIMIGGEPLSEKLLQILQEKTTSKIYNMYGPTETTIWSTISDLTNKKVVDIGVPIKNTKIYIIDDKFSVLPYGEIGEICIAGKGLARGYVGKFDLTKEKFICLQQKSNIKIYRTGDVGRFLDDGNLEYLGRLDNQYKIRGHRIELEEIEAYISKFKGINQAIVIVTETNDNGKVLQAYYTGEAIIDPTELKNYLSERLPEYMIPITYKQVEQFFYTITGKIDRKRVTECIGINSQAKTRRYLPVEEYNEVQIRVFDIIVSNLNSKLVDNITPKKTLSELGIDSIVFVKIIVNLEKEFNISFDENIMISSAFSNIEELMIYVDTIIKNK